MTTKKEYLLDKLSESVREVTDSMSYLSKSIYELAITVKEIDEKLRKQLEDEVKL